MISIVVIRLSASVLQYTVYIDSSSCSSITIGGEPSLEGNLENVGEGLKQLLHQVCGRPLWGKLFVFLVSSCILASGEGD